MINIRRIIEAVVAGVAPRAAVGQELSLDALPHGWRDSDASGSRIKVLYNPTEPKRYKGRLVKYDAHGGSWSYIDRGAEMKKGVGTGELTAYLHKVHTTEALDPDSERALRPRGIKRAEPVVDTPKPARKKREPVDPALRQRAMNWDKYRTQHSDETPEEHTEKIRTVFANHGFVHVQHGMAGVESYQHPEHPEHVIHYLSGPNRPEGSPDGSWYHHDRNMVAHNSGHDSDSLDVHLGQFFGGHNA